MPKKRFYEKKIKKIAGIEVEEYTLYIKNNGVYTLNSGKPKYYLDGVKLKDFSKIKLVCPTCGQSYVINWKLVKSHPKDRRLCYLCKKRKDNNFYRPEWHDEESIRKRVRKTKETNLKKYGVTCNLHSNEGISKKKQTWLNNYGVDNPAKCEYVVNKAINTIMKKDISFYSKMNNRYYSNIYNKWLYYQSKNELDFIYWCENNENIYNISRGPMIRIKSEERNHCVTCDFLIIYKNNERRLVEIKGGHPGWWDDKHNGRWKVEKAVLEKYSYLHNYLKFFLVFNNKKETYERTWSGKN